MKRGVLWLRLYYWWPFEWGSAWIMNRVAYHAKRNRPSMEEVIKETKLGAEEIKSFERGVYECLAGRLEYAVDHNREIRNLTDEELEEADRLAEDRRRD